MHSFRSGSTVSGFRILRSCPMTEEPGLAVEARHPRTGLHVLHLANADPENLFAIAFRTPPPDNSGVAHIVEHSVLGGSLRFPVKDPFLEMLKSSMATFINAMTYTDRTVYPVASNVKADFINLVTVYLDAVFHPRIAPETLEQEGHHLAFEKPGDTRGELFLTGIVYNEMKGAFSDPDARVDSCSSRLLFPDTIYRFESGGLPEEIPNLDYEAFSAYYRAHYHPANAYVFLYGDIPTEEMLTFLDAQLGDLPTSSPPAVSDPVQPKWRAERSTEILLPIGADESPAANGQVTMNWYLGPLEDPVDDLAMAVLDRALLGDAAAPLRKALVDSRLGDDLTSSGYENGSFLTSFHVGLKGVNAERAGEVEKGICDSLARIARDGIPSRRIEAAFRQLTYERCEIRPLHPLHVMEDAFGVWLYGRDPLRFLDTGRNLHELRSRWEHQPDFFIRLLQDGLLTNRHRLTVIGRPVPGLAAEREDKHRRDLAGRRDAMGERERRRIAREAVQLAELQECPDSPEALARLPQLQLSDVPPEPSRLACVTEPVGDGCTVIHNEVFTNGINYVLLGIDVTDLPSDLVEHLPVYAGLFNRLGTGSADYLATAERLAWLTGGVQAGVLPAKHVETGADSIFLTLSFKALDDTFGEAWSLVEELFHELDFRDAGRLRNVLVQRKSALLSQVASNGHRLAALQAGRGLSGLAGLSWLWHGLPQVRSAQMTVAREDDESLAEACRKLENLRRFLVRAPLRIVSFSGNPAFRSRVEQRASRWAQTCAGECLREGPREFFARDAPSARAPEGLSFDLDVAFCARCLPAPGLHERETVPMHVAAQLLSYGFLWDEIRVKGGAYGAFCRYDPVGAVLSLISYRDPDPRRTLGVFAELDDRVRDADWTPDLIRRAVIACAKDDQRPVRPASATADALSRYVSGVDDGWRREYRRRLLGVDTEAVRGVFRALTAHGVNGERATCVVASRRVLRTLGNDVRIESVVTSPPTGPTTGQTADTRWPGSGLSGTRDRLPSRFRPL